MAAQVRAATPAEIVSLRSATATFQQYASAVSRAVAARFAYWESLVDTAADFAVDPADIIGAELTQRNVAANEVARKWALVVRALDAGEAQLAAWSETEGGSLHLGVVRRDTLTLQGWPLVPLIVVGALSVGAWMIADAWLTARTIEADALLLRSQTEAAASKAVVEASRTNPQAAAVLADALKRASSQASQPASSVFDRLLGASGQSTVGIGLILAALWLLSRKGKR